MKARTRTAVGAAFLLAAAIGAAAVAWFGVHLRGREEKAAETRTRRILAIEPAKVREIRIASRGSDVRLEREGDSWRLAAPVRADADRETVDRLLGALSGLERRAESAKPGERADALAPYGLAAPRTRIEVAVEGGRTESLALGDDSGFDGVMFVMPTSGEVDVVASNARADLEPTLDALRDKRILRFAREDAWAVRVEGEGGPAAAVEVRHRPGAAPGAAETWETLHPARSAPDVRPADAWKAAGLVSALASLEAASFGGEGDAAARAAGLDRPRRTYTVLGKDGKEIARLLLGVEKDGSVPARSPASPQVFLVDPWRLKGLATSAEDLAPAPPPAPAPAPAPATGAGAPPATGASPASGAAPAAGPAGSPPAAPGGAGSHGG
jgi:hypothetical protein